MELNKYLFVKWQTIHSQITEIFDITIYSCVLAEPVFKLSPLFELKIFFLFEALYLKQKFSKIM